MYNKWTPLKEPQSTGFENDTLLGGRGGVGWTEKPQVIELGNSNPQPAHGVFEPPETAEVNCMCGFASTGSPNIVQGGLEEH